MSPRRPVVEPTLTVGGTEGAPTPPTVESAPQVCEEAPGRYVEEGELGRGGIGRVMGVTDRFLGRSVAMKEVLSGTSSSSVTPSEGAARARFLQEARITARLEHPSIVPLYELGEKADGTLYYTMRRVEGGSLADAVRKAPDIRARLRLLPHMVDLCQAIAYAHSRGVVHRDIKPANVLIGDFGETMVIDWGLARRRGEADPRQRELLPGPLHSPDLSVGIDLTVAGAVLGTPLYMSPEQAAGRVEEIDERSDVWSLGAVLFVLLTGAAPHQRRSGPDLLRVVATTEPPRARSLEPAAPPELEAIAARALSLRPTDRYPSAAELAAELNNWQEGRRVAAYHYSMREVLGRFVDRHRAAVGVGTGLSLLLALVGVLSIIRLGQRKEEAEAAREEALHQLGQALAERSLALLAAGRGGEAAIVGAEALRQVERADLRGLLILESNLGLPRLIGSWEQAYCGALAWSPDGRSLACGALPDLFIWGPGGERSFPHNQGGVYALAWSRDGILASGGADGSVVRWQAESGREIDRHGLLDAEVLSLLYTDRALLAGGWGHFLEPVPTGEGVYWPGGLKRWDHNGELWTMALSPDGKSIAVGGTGRLPASVRSATDLSAQSDWAPPQGAIGTFAVAWSPDGSRSAWGDGEGVLRLLDRGESGASLTLRGHEGAIYALSWLEDGRIVTGGADTTVRLWDPDRGRELFEIPGHQGQVREMAASGERLAVASRDGVLRIWQLGPDPTLLPWPEGHTGDELKTLSGLATCDQPPSLLAAVQGPHGVELLRWGEGGQPIPAPPLVAGTDTLALRCAGATATFLSAEGLNRMDLGTGENRLLDPIEAPPATAMVMDPSGRRVLVVDAAGMASLYDTASGERLGEYSLPLLPDNAPVAGGDHSRLLLDRGETLVDIGPEGSLNFRDSTSGELQRRLSCPMGMPSELALDPSGRLLLWNDREGRLLLVDLKSGTTTALEGPGGPLTPFRFLAANRVAAGGSDGSVWIWELPTGRSLAHWSAHQARVLAVSPLGDGLVTMAQGEPLRRWDLSALDTSPAQLRGHFEGRLGLHLKEGVLRAVHSSDRPAAHLSPAHAPR